MCGRYVLRTLDRILDEFDVRADDLVPRMNVAPTEDVPVVRGAKEDRHRRELAMMHWGLIPSWAKDPAAGNKMINARAETLIERPAFRMALARRRCLIPADGFYEWKKVEGAKRKRQYYFHRPNGRLMAFAGLWERWRDDAGHAIDSCTIITTRPNKLVAEVHDRMPAIIGPGEYERWLASEEPAEEIQRLLGPMPEGELAAEVVEPKGEGTLFDCPGSG